MAWRETRSSWARLGFFFLCVGIGVASIVALRSIVQQVRTTLTGEARTLIAADVVVQSSHPLGEDLRAKIARLSTGHTVSATTQVVDTQTMASPLEGQGTGNVKLVELRGVAAAFPFYGQIELAGGGIYSHALLANHGAIVQPELLFALGIGPGDQFRMAGETFTIRGVIARDRIQRGGIAFGPRVYIDLDTLRATSLLGFGSRATYQLLMRVRNPADTTPLTDALRAGLREDLVGVRSWQTLENRIGENLTTAENYLSLVGFAIVVLGGLGVWSVTRVIVRQKIRSVAILKCLGAPSRSVLAILLLQVLGLATLGCLLGVALAAVGLAAIPASLLTSLGVAAVPVTASAALQGAAVGLLVSLLFALMPLLEVRHVKPLLLLRAHSADTARRRTWQSGLAGTAVAAALALVAIWQAESVRAGAYASGGLVVVAGGLFLASLVLVRVARPFGRSTRFAIRHGALHLGRPGNQTRMILMAVGLGCFFVVGVRAVQTNLLRELATQVSERSPDFVMIDVQRDQVRTVEDVVAPYVRSPARVVPLMRARVVGVQGRQVQLPTVDDVRKSGHLGREYGLTFRSTLEPNERVRAGRFWTSALEAGPEPGVDTDVSVEEQASESAHLGVGDLIRFDIGGTILRARVTNIRTVAWNESENGGFVFVLRPAPAVDAAPHSYIGFVQVRRDPADAGDLLQRDIVKALPNVSVIDVRDVLASVRDVVDNVTLGITVVGVVTLVSGVLILIGAVAMTKFQRVYEVAIYRTLGASTRRLTAMLAAEYGLLGVLAGALGSGGGLVLSWILARYLFQIEWQMAPALLVAGVVLTGVLVCVVGVVANVDVLIRKPLPVLRSE